MSESKKKIPKRRFKEFENADAWEQRTLGEILYLLKDGTHGTHQDVEDGPLLLSAKNIKNGQINWDSSDRRISESEYEKIHSNFTLEKEDILLTIVGSIGETAILKDNYRLTFQRSVAYLRPKSDIKPEFLYSEIQSPRFQKELMNRKSTSAQPGIYLGDLSVIPVSNPKNLEEQIQIGIVFVNLDNLITLHQRKADKLKALKSAYLNEMFPEEGETKPKRRFKGFTDDWEQRKLGEFGKATSGTSIESEFTEAGKYKVISIGSYSEMSNYTDQGIRADKTNKTECRILNKDDLTMILNDKTASGNIIGRVLLIDADNTYIYNQRTERIEVNKNEYEPIFLYQLLNADNIRLKIIRASQGNTQIYVNWSAIRELKYTVPLLKSEQKQIGAFFSNLDNLITLHQRKVDKLQNLKKAYLNEMFV